MVPLVILAREQNTPIGQSSSELIAALLLRHRKHLIMFSRYKVNVG
jgi:hypothetical protein